MIQPLPHPGEAKTIPVERAPIEGEKRPEAKLAFLDTETTGLDPERNEVWEVGLIVGAEELHWYLPVNMKRADADALRIGGFYERHPLGRGIEWEKADNAEVARELARLTANAHLVGVNPAFDATFLGAFIRANGQVPAWSYHLVDVLPLIAGHCHIRPPWSSRDLSQAIHVEPPADDDRHTALGDARWAKRMYEAVLGG